MIKILSIIIYLLCSTSGLTLIKLGTEGTKISFINGLIDMTFNWKLIVGFIVYVISFILYTLVISKYNLSYIYPILTALLFILVMLSSAFVLKENISTLQIVGVIIIIIGVLLTTIKN